MKQTLVMILAAAMLFTAGCTDRAAQAEEAPAVTETPAPTPDPEEAQRLEEVAVEPTDVPMPAIVTEEKVRRYP